MKFSFDVRVKVFNLASGLAKDKAFSFTKQTVCLQDFKISPVAEKRREAMPRAA